MKQNGAVQFYGISKALSAYENRRAPSFALWWGSQLLHRYMGNDLEEGKQELKEFLNEIDSPDSLATYTLTVYEKVPSGGITSKTPYDGSFNFKIHGTDQRTTYFQERDSRYKELEEKIEALQEEINERDEKPKGFLGVLSGIVDNPQVQEMLVARVMSIIDRMMNTENQMEQPRQLGKVAGIPDEHSYQEQLNNINQALPVLYQADPQIGDHLLLLAGIAQKTPGKFQALISMLKDF